MSLFGSRKKTSVDTVIMRVIEDAYIPNMVRNALAEAIFSNSNFSDNLQQQILNGTFRSFERAYRYARDGGYYLGLPNTRVISSESGIEELQQVLDTLAGQAVTIDYAYYRPPNNVHLAREILTNQYGYNWQTNQLDALTAIKGHPVYLENIVSVYQLASLEDAEPNTLGIWGDSPDSGYTPERPAQTVDSGLQPLLADGDYRYGENETESAEVHILWVIPEVIDEITGETLEAAQTVRETLVLDLSGFDMDKEYFQAQYRYGAGSAEVVRYFTYLPETGTYPLLDEVYATDYTNPGTFFPIIPFRLDKVNQATPATEETEAYITTKKLLKYLGMDYQEVSDAIHENPDIGDVEHAFLFMATPITSTNEVDIEYLLEFFKHLSGLTPEGETVTGDRAANLKWSPNASYALEIVDSKFRMVLSYDQVHVRLRTGSIGPVGTVASLTEDEIPGLKLFGEQVLSPKSTKVFRKQITSQVYEEVVVINPQTKYTHRTRGLLSGGTDDKCLIPLNYEIAKQFNILKRDVLYQRAAHFVFHALVEYKLKWYETGVFKAIITVVGIVLTVMAWGADGGFFAQLGAAVAAGVNAVVWFILKPILIAIALQESFKVVVKVLGPEFAAILAVAVAAMGVYKGMTAGFGQGTWANRLLATSQLLVDGTKSYMADAFKKLQSDAEDFELLAETKWEELEEARDMLRTDAYIDPLSLIRIDSTMLPGELPESFYTRSIHSGNVGAMCFDFIENFVELSIRLPTIRDTVGDSFYE
jgi:hypothetical protein